ncbi:unnamed protein product [Lota lota]
MVVLPRIKKSVSCVLAPSLITIGTAGWLLRPTEQEVRPWPIPAPYIIHEIASFPELSTAGILRCRAGIITHHFSNLLSPQLVAYRSSLRCTSCPKAHPDTDSLSTRATDPPLG